MVCKVKNHKTIWGKNSWAVYTGERKQSEIEDWATENQLEEYNNIPDKSLKTVK